MDQPADAGDYQEHHYSQLIDLQVDAARKVPAVIQVKNCFTKEFVRLRKFADRF